MGITQVISRRSPIMACPVTVLIDLLITEGTVGVLFTEEAIQGITPILDPAMARGSTLHLADTGWADFREMVLTVAAVDSRFTMDASLAFVACPKT